MNITRTPGGFRFSEGGVVISELRCKPGPTHSVFNVLAALIGGLAPAGQVALLGFAGGSLLAPLRQLGATARIAGVDLDPTGPALFRRHCECWAGAVSWEQADAARWLLRQPAGFNLIVDDLSIVEAGAVVKPAITWEVLPQMVRQRLAPGGLGIFNLLLPPEGRWRPGLDRIRAPFENACVVDLADFENRILVVGRKVPSARHLAAQLRRHLVRIGSRQAGKVRVRGLR